MIDITLHGGFFYFVSPFTSPYIYIFIQLLVFGPFILFPFFVFCFLFFFLQAKDLLENGHGVLGPLDRVADGAGILVDFVVVATLGRLVAEEVNVVVGDAVGLLGLGLEVLEAVCLVPAGGEDVKGDLSADGEAIRTHTHTDTVWLVLGGFNKL